MRIFAFWIQNCYYFFWDDIRDGVMIRDDHIDAEGFRMAYRIYITSSTVDGDDEFDSLIREFIEEVAFQSITIMHTVGKSIRHFTSYLSEESYEDSRR